MPFQLMRHLSLNGYGHALSLDNTSRDRNLDYNAFKFTAIPKNNTQTTLGNQLKVDICEIKNKLSDSTCQ